MRTWHGQLSKIESREIADDQQQATSVRLIGLTGGIASGKSTVCGMFAECGASVVDADALYHGLIAPGPAGPSFLAVQVEESFPGVLDSSGAIDRRRLGRLVFADAAALTRLGAITHPAVAAAFAQRCAREAAQGTSLLVYDVPLLFERGLQQQFEGVVVVWVARAEQVRRLVARNSLTRDEAEKRLASQWPLQRKRARATWVVDNGGDLEETRTQVLALWQDMHV